MTIMRQPRPGLSILVNLKYDMNNLQTVCVAALGKPLGD